jgi:hypothetical protein
MFKHPVRVSKKTPYFSITKISWLMKFREIIAVYSEKNKGHNAFCPQNVELLIVRAGGTYCYHWILSVRSAGLM